MFILNLLLILFIIILLIVIFSSITKFSMFCIVKYNYTSKALLLPAICDILSTAVITTIWYIFMTKVLHINFADILFNFIIKNDNSLSTYIPILLITIGFIFIGILLQSLCYLLLNLCYEDEFGNIRIKRNNNFKDQNNQNNQNNINKTNIEENSISNISYIPKISYFNALIASIFSFALTFFVICILLFIGSIISNKFI